MPSEQSKTAVSSSRTGEAGSSGRIEQHSGCHLEALNATERDVFMLDVDEHVGVDRVQGGEPGRPVDRVVPAAECDEVPRGVLRPLVGPFVAAEVRTRLIWAQPTEPVVEYAVDSGGGINTHVLRGGMEHERAEVLHHRYRVHPLPKQMRGVQLDANVGSASALHQLADTGGIEHQVLRVQFERDLNV